MTKRKPLLLIMDQDTDFVDILKRRLEVSGWGVKRVKSIEQAKKELVKKRTDVFFLDTSLEIRPEVSLREILEDPAFHHPKLIVHNDVGAKKDIASLKEAGVHVYWMKGHVALPEIVRQIKKLV